MTEAFSALLAKLEAATGPSHALNREIHEALHGSFPSLAIQFPRYSGSIDAAMTLVPDGWVVAELQQNYYSEGGELNSLCWTAGVVCGWKYGQAKFNERIKTAALALCIAAVRARLAGQKEHP